LPADRRETTAYTALLPAGSDNEAVVIYGLLRYWTTECNHSSGITVHCYNRSIHGSEIRANYGFAMRITRQLLDVAPSPPQLNSDDAEVQEVVDPRQEPRWLMGRYWA
jgi:hypothetical protein